MAAEGGEGVMGGMEFKFGVYLLLILAVPAFCYIAYLWACETINKWRRK
ncbi:MAG: hypothetical protein BWZ00_01567 [Bacteroidetes bacterium ADurb.BinA174]|nr:MAG: hypothetical protein BWZ00_01567 [Bacteroidetes bacterium ADurb.BinA174]